jgi:hypothetical protein
MEGFSDYADDPNIADADVLWRRVRPDWVNWDENVGAWRPSSAAFQNSSDGSPMSVLIEKIVITTNRAAIDMLSGRYADHSLCAFTAGFARELGHQVATLPRVLDEPAHGWVAGKKTESVKQKMKRRSEWVIVNPPPPLAP